MSKIKDIYLFDDPKGEIIKQIKYEVRKYLESDETGEKFIYWDDLKKILRERI